MALYVSGSGGACAGNLRGTLIGPIKEAQTGSFYNADSGSAVCTGSMIIHTYSPASPSETGETIGQKLFIWLSGSTGTGAGDADQGGEWVFITGSTGCVDPV